MKHKTVSFEVAKALKEAGYWDPGTIIKCSYNNGCYIDDGRFYEHGCVCPWDRLYPAPTYIDAWLWLWREKEIRICLEDAWDLQEPEIERGCYVFTNQLGGICSSKEFADPEDAIVDIIEYLVRNDLIK